MTVTFDFPDGVPLSEIDRQFIQGMMDRMAMSYHKYGAVKDGYPKKVCALRSMQVRLDKYADDGNLEHLMDAANFIMIEFMCPSEPTAHFTPTDRSPGRAWRDEVDLSQRGNKDI